MVDGVPVYLFRDPHFAPAGDTVVCVAPSGEVVKVYGGGGFSDSAGLDAAFAGAVAFRDDRSGNVYLGVWGARKAAKFRNALRQTGLKLELIKAAPPGRLVWYSTSNRAHPPTA
jgi:hypothetical protein